LLSSIPIYSPEDRYYPEISRIYREAFADEERVPFDSLLEWVNSGLEGMVGLLGAFIDAGQVVAMGSAAFFPNYWMGYLPYLAVRQDVRGRGYGRQTVEFLFDWIMQRAGEMTGENPCLVFWDVRDPDDSPDEAERTIRQRRIKFYRQLGSEVLPIAYTYPPVAKGQPYVRSRLMAFKYGQGKAVITRQEAIDLAYLAIIRIGHNPETSTYWKDALQSIDRHWPS